MTGSEKVDLEAAERLRQEKAKQLEENKMAGLVVMPDSPTTSGSEKTPHPGQQASSALLAGRIEQANYLREEYRRQLSEEYGRKISCIACHDTGRYVHSQEACGCERGRRLAQIDEERRVREWTETMPEKIGVPAIFRDLGLHTHPDHLGNLAVRMLASWRDNYLLGNTNPSLYIHGDFGVGKTGLACALLQEFVMGFGIRNNFSIAPGAAGRFTTATAMMDALRNFDGAGGETAERAAHDFATIPWLVIDDFGAEKLTTWGVDRLFNIINQRQTENRTMIITSNYSLDRMIDKITGEVNDIYGRRIVERLQQSCDVIGFPGDSRNLRRV